MSSEEKAAQVGTAVAEYQEAKVHLAHVEKKMAAVASAYKAFGSALDDSARNAAAYGDRIKIVDGIPKIDWSNDSPATRLMNAAELAELINERNSALKRRDSALESLKALGITSVA